jgi:putative transcriptional regulator
MSTIKTIRERLGLTQAALAEGMGCTQGNVGHYEKGQTVPPDAAKRLITFARTLGHEVSYEDIYGSPEAVGQADVPEVAAKAEAA